jgi:membrane protein DedA with SNARE-associated domain
MSLDGIESWVAHWGYAAIFLGILLGNVGVPLPEESILLLSGYLAWRGTLSLPAVIAVGIVSAVAGDNLGYWIGREGGRPLLLRYGRYCFVSPRQMRRAEQFFARHGHRAVFFGRFIAGMRFLAGPLAGISRMRFGRFFAYNASGAVVYVSVVALVGFAAGSHLHAVLANFKRAEHFIALAAAILLAGLAWRFLRRKKE